MLQIRVMLSALTCFCDTFRLWAQNLWIFLDTPPPPSSSNIISTVANDDMDTLTSGFYPFDEVIAKHVLMDCSHMMNSLPMMNRTDLSSAINCKTEKRIENDYCYWIWMKPSHHRAMCVWTCRAEKQSIIRLSDNTMKGIWYSMRTTVHTTQCLQCMRRI